MTAHTPFSGKIILADKTLGARELKLGDIEAGIKAPTWDEASAGEFLDRVKAKAAAKAAETLIAARTEAEAIRKTAHEEGFAAGQAAAQMLLDEAQARIAEAGRAMEEDAVRTMGSIQAGLAKAYGEFREDMAALVRLAVEKVLRCELSEERGRVLAALLDQSVEALMGGKRLIAWVNPVDAEQMSGLVEAAKSRHRGLEHWKIRTDPAIEPGGLVVETDTGRVDNSIATRLASVAEILGDLEFPPSTCELDPAQAVQIDDSPEA